MKRDALNNIPVDYSKEVLDRVRKEMSIIPISDIRKRLQDRNRLQFIPEERTHRNAVAHVLVEMGLAVRQDCFTGTIIAGE
jgi:predicted nucleotidyltransferase